MTLIAKVKEYKKYGFAAVAVLIAAILVISVVRAVSTSGALATSFEAEAGTIAGCSSVVNDATASGGKAVSYSSCPGNATTENVPAGIAPGAMYQSYFTSSLSAAQQQAAVAQMKATGTTWLRVDVPSTFPYDTLIKDAVAAGIHVDAVLQNWTTASTPAAMASFATQAVNHLKPMGVSTYEVLNEPNGCLGTMTAADYTAILKSSYTAIKAADPASAVITAGLCPKSGSNEPYTYLQAMYAAGAAGYFDAVGMHPYSYPDTPLQTTDTWNPWSYLGQMHAIMTNNGDGNKKIWLTEFGCPTGSSGGYTAYCTDASLATQITDAYSLARTQSWIGPLFIYSWRDSGAGDGDFGLYLVDGSPKTLSLNAFTRAANHQ